MAEIEDQRRTKAEEQLRKREEAKARKKAGDVSEEVMADAGQINEPGDETDSDDMDEDMSDSGVNFFCENSNCCWLLTSLQEGNSAMAALLASARARAAEYEADHGDDNDDEEEDDDETSNNVTKDTSRRAFDKMFKQVVDAADVVLYVLDARDPEGTRSRDVERAVMAADGGEKRLILILNKIDLIPPSVLKGWLTYLRRYFPTLPLRASNSAPNAHTFDHKALTVQGTSAALLKALKSFAHSKQLKRSVSVGVIGYPNVGKSSVINALTGRLGGTAAACPTGAEAGVTTSLREVKLDKKLKLIDSPGIVFPGSSEGASKDDQSRLILLNAVPPKQINDPVPAINLLIKRLSTSEALFAKLLALYDLPPLNTGRDITNDFLVQVARKRGRLGKGGIPNIDAAAKTVIMDWRDGRIQGWIDPPVLAGTVAALTAAKQHGGVKEVYAEPAEDQKVIVKEWAAEFKLDGLWGDDGAEEEEEVEEVEMEVEMQE